MNIYLPINSYFKNLLERRISMPFGKASFFLSGILLCLLLLAAGPVFAENFSRVDLPSNTANYQQPNNAKDIAANQFRGYMRLVVTEPVSRYGNDADERHLHGMLGVPLDMEITLNDHDTLRGDLVYNNTAMSSSNIEVIGAVYEYEVHTNYSDPPSGNPFQAHWVNAAAVATPGHPGMEAATPPYTHTVFVEYVTRYS
jgi:hypothetical protein